MSAYVALIDPYQDKLNLYEGEDAFAADFTALPEKIKVLLPADLTMGEVCNGGFYQYFWNASGIAAPEAVVAFEALGLPNMAGLVRAVMGFFGPDYPRDQEQRQAALQKYEDANRNDANADLPYLTPFETADEAFFVVMTEEGGGFELAADNYAQLEARP